MSENTKNTVTKENKNATVKEAKKEKFKLKLDKKKLAIIITAAVVALTLIITGIIYLVDAIQRDVFFDYLKSDLSQYIEFTEDYKDFELNIDIAKPHDIDFEVTKLNMLCGDKPTTPWIKGSQNSLIIKPGDVVYIWYRGYLVGDDGETTEVDGMCNFSGDEPYALEIGSNGFIPGFELGLLGQKTGAHNKFVKITSGAVNEEQIVYIGYSVTEGESTSKTTKSDIRIELSSDDIDENYGEGFKEKLLSLTIGTKVDFETTLGEKTLKYTNLNVSYATECENDYFEVDCYFPYDYSNADLRNEDARFEVYIAKIDCYYEQMPEFDDEYLKKKIEDGDIAVTLEKLDEYEGETLVDKYEAYAKELMEKVYESEYKSLVESAVWSHYSEISKVKKYPTAKVDDKYYSYATEIYNLYLSNGGQIYNSYYGSYDSYDTFDEYANAYLGINSYSEYYYYGTTAWQYYVYDMAREFVKERLVLYYIMREEGLVPSDDFLKSEIEIVKQEYVDEYVDQYLTNEDKTKDDYTEEEFEKFTEDRRKEILSYYGDTHFEERVYYNIMADNIVNWPKVTTLDERRAYPVTEEQ